MSASWQYLVDHHTTLPHPAKHLLSQLAAISNDNGIAYPSISTLSERCGFSKNTVLRWTRYLEEIGILSKTKDVLTHKRGTVYHRTNIYVLKVVDYLKRFGYLITKQDKKFNVATPNAKPTKAEAIDIAERSAGRETVEAQQGVVQQWHYPSATVEPNRVLRDKPSKTISNVSKVSNSVEDEVKVSVTSEWRPSAETITTLEAAGLPSEFIESCRNTFVGYWIDSPYKLTQSAYESRFAKHVRVNWEHAARKAAKAEAEAKPEAETVISPDDFAINAAVINAVIERCRSVGTEPVTDSFVRGRVEPFKTWASERKMECKTFEHMAKAFITFAVKAWGFACSAPNASALPSPATATGWHVIPATDTSRPTKSRTVAEGLSDRSWAMTAPLATHTVSKSAMIAHNAEDRSWAL